ncbi:MAG TPA: hypothetical protein VMS93_06785 [Candidatus Saccharimonadales bacterium]|nr:hypothetical protein [Candidatus Saccharimonadales bacterium]
MNPIPITFGTSAAHRASLQKFLEAEGLPWALVEAPGGTLNLVEQDPPAECDVARLFPGGRILCSVALAMAETYQAPAGSIGRLMNLLKIKIHDCQLGCFR